MGDTEVVKIVDKLQKIRGLKRAREAVRQLERDLYGAVGKPAAAVEVPHFLHPLHSSRVL